MKCRMVEHFADDYVICNVMMIKVWKTDEVKDFFF